MCCLFHDYVTLFSKKHNSNITICSKCEEIFVCRKCKSYEMELTGDAESSWLYCLDCEKRKKSEKTDRIDELRRKFE